MRNSVLLILFLIFSAFSITSDNNSLTGKNLKGKISTLKETFFEVVNSTGAYSDSILVARIESEFDKKGNLIEFGHYNSKGNIVNKETYTYDEKGNLLENAFFNILGSIDSKEVYTYDAGNNKKQCSIYRYDGSLNSTCSYKNTKNETECTRFDLKGNVITREVFKYNGNGSKIEYEGYNFKDILDSKTIYVYDEKKKLVKDSTYFPEFKGHSIYVYKYDENGNLKEESNYSDDADNKLTLVYSYSYSYKSFDKEGNWIKLVKSENGKAIGFITRKIEYFK